MARADAGAPFLQASSSSRNPATRAREGHAAGCWHQPWVAGIWEAETSLAWISAAATWTVQSSAARSSLVRNGESLKGLWAAPFRPAAAIAKHPGDSARSLDLDRVDHSSARARAVSGD